MEEKYEIKSIDEARKYYKENLEGHVKEGAKIAYETFRHTFKPFRASVDGVIENRSSLDGLIDFIGVWKGIMIGGNPQFNDNFYRDEVMLKGKPLVDLSNEELVEYGRSRFH